MRDKEFDFGGWATVNNLKCSDGRRIMQDAFSEQDGERVPLVWGHQHGEISHVLGYATLENRKEGVYAYCSFNDSDAGKNARIVVEHGDVQSLSIYANELQQQGSDVIHGIIREVSLVLAGANPAAKIENVCLAHSDLILDDQAFISMGDEYTHIEFLEHANKDDEEKEAESKKETDESKEEEKTPASETKKEEEKKNSESDNEKTVGNIVKDMNEEQQQAVAVLVAKALEKKKQEISKGGEEEMKHNLFESGEQTNQNTLMHDGLNTILAEGRRYGSLKESYLAHAAEYGIENIEFLQPDDKDLYDRPQFINNQPTGWVQVVMNGVHKTPFAKVRMMFADITEDEARAKGYTKGKLKKEEVFKLLKRSVGPTTIYKKQKFDRDDLIDADFDVIPWIKQEMNLKFDEEKARAYIFGDGRSSADEDKINESCIIPVVTDAELYAIQKTITPESGESLEHAIITGTVVALDDYQGSGNTTAFIEAKQVSKMLLMEDQFGHRLYKNIQELAGAMGVGQVVKVPAGIVPNGIYGVVLDLSDYNVGMKDSGRRNFFDDFDIDYNQNKYLLEERQSGALTRPYSAIVLNAATE